jgi:hypothetical protein
MVHHERAIIPYLTKLSGTATFSHNWERTMTTKRRPEAVHRMTNAEFEAGFQAGDEEAHQPNLVARRGAEGDRN